MFQSELYLIVVLLQKHILKDSPCQRNLQCRLGHTERKPTKSLKTRAEGVQR